uniref:Uncharacterized protein n=1 Tax=Oryza nivara TaxID=4536 RepID=A0A0E0IZX3_ORYNI
MDDERRRRLFLDSSVAQPQHPLAGDGHGRRRAAPLPSTPSRPTPPTAGSSPSSPPPARASASASATAGGWSAFGPDPRATASSDT